MLQSELASEASLNPLPPSPRDQSSVCGKRPIVIGISGASCSGKSWLAGKIHQQRIHDSLIMDLDGYYRDLKDVEALEHGHDNPDSIDVERAVRDLQRLKAGQSCDLPVYCFENHRLKGVRHCPSTPIILIEGLFVFAHPQLRDEIDIKIWMEARQDLLLERRIDRDTVHRERSVEEIRERYQRDVIPGFHKFIQPLRIHADVIVENDGRDAEAIPLMVKLILAFLAQTSGQSGATEFFAPRSQLAMPHCGSASDSRG